MTRICRFLNEALATCFFLTYPLAALAKKKGNRLTGAGFIGSLAGVLTVLVLPLKPEAYAFFLAGALLISVAISDAAEESLGQTDDQRIVIDEWIGYLVSVAFLPRTYGLWVIGFVLFRILDTWKPFGIRNAGNLPGGWGVVMDDVVAGLVVNAFLHLLPLS